MGFTKEDLDFVLVPAGFLIMLAYHLCLLLKYNNDSDSSHSTHSTHSRIYCTSIGVEINDKNTLVERILNDGSDAKVSAGLGVISTNSVAAMTLASVSLVLCTLIGSWIGSSTSEFVPVEMIYGNTSEMLISIKYLCVLISLLLAFSFFVQSARHFIHSNYLFGTPGATVPEDVEKVNKIRECVKRGSIFWSLGLRSLYFALNFMLWFFGPIPMCSCSIVIVFALACHDNGND